MTGFYFFIFLKLANSDKKFISETAEDETFHKNTLFFRYQNIKEQIYTLSGHFLLFLSMFISFAVFLPFDAFLFL